MGGRKQGKTVQTRICILNVDSNKREFDALDLDSGMVFSIDVNQKIDLSRIEKGKIICIRIKISKVMKSSAFQTLFRFELISIDPFV